MTQVPIHAAPDPLTAIPAALRDRPQWVLWQGQDIVSLTTGEIRFTKIPIDAVGLEKASTTDPRTWAPFATAVAAIPVALEEWEADPPPGYRGGGLGFVLTGDDPYVGIDLDHVRDETTEMIEDWARDIVDAMQSYTEVSPSGTGLHIWIEGTLPPEGRKKGQVEIYSTGRYFTVTGLKLPGTPDSIAACQEALLALHARLFVPHPAPQGAADMASSGFSMEDHAVYTHAKDARNGAKFVRLWGGDWDGYDSQSEADLALCSMLTFWTQDPAQIDRLFQSSGLLRPKWHEARGEGTYGARTVATALRLQTEHYTPPPQLRVGSANGTMSTPPPGWTTGAAASQEPAIPVALPWSDTLNAIHFVRDYGTIIRYCFPWKSWLVWNGRHWERDTAGTVMALAKNTIKRLAAHAATLQDDDKMKALLTHVKRSLSTSALEAMVRNAQSEDGIPVQPDAFDTHVWLLGVDNGTLDLTTGALHPHRQADMLTKCLPIPYDSGAMCPAWTHFLWRIMGGTMTPDTPEMSAAALEARHAADVRAQALIDFLQRAIGYALTGSTREQCLFILHGITKTGKSTFLAILRALYGAYGQQADMQSFMHKDRQEVRNDLADLAGSRFVCALESQEGQRLAESLIKQLTGGTDLLKARFLFQEYFTFKPQFKIFLGTNHKPVIKDTDAAIWERIRLVPFTAQIPVADRDKTLDDTLQHELPGILAWAMRGCLEWQRRGDLCAPEAVTHATATYREESDAFGRFIEECCLVSPQVQAKSSELYDAYKRWCEAGGEQAMTLTKFGNRLEEQGFGKEKKGTVWRKGLALLRVTGDDDNDGVPF